MIKQTVDAGMSNMFKLNCFSFAQQLSVTPSMQVRSENPETLFDLVSVLN
jgi:hypothetical protein